MEIPHVILFFTGMLLLAILVEPLAEKSRLPFSAALILVGFISSEVLVSFSIDTGIRWDNFYDLIFYVFLPILIFEAAFNMNARLLFKNIIPVLFMAIPLMLLSTGLIAVFLYYSIGYPEGFPWIAALLTGALLSATDPIAVLALFKKIGAPHRLSILVDGESLFNDATAIVMVTLLVSLATSSHGGFEWSATTLEFLRIFFGGAITGGLVGMLGYVLIPRIASAVTGAVVSLISAYMAFIIAEAGFHVSGVMAVLVAGLMLGHTSRNRQDEGRHGFMEQLWEYKSYMANAMLFLISGVTIQIAMFTDQWLAIVIGIAAALIARAVGIFAVIPGLNLLPGVESVGMGYRIVMYWGGIRGAITLALALSLPVELPYWWTIQSIAYGVVIFTLFVQAPTMPLLMKKVAL
ncbi:MAG: sodium:proton antiporter [Gammaproteobacteria bacterium]|nr:sodium:proton antiporter [Gammaproteobacteria bacterium]